MEISEYYSIDWKYFFSASDLCIANEDYGIQYREFLTKVENLLNKQLGKYI